MRTPAARTIARKTRRVCWRARHGQYIGELHDVVSTALRVTETVGSCTMRRDEYDVDEEDGGEDEYAGE
jgi:hypothetical protein